MKKSALGALSVAFGLFLTGCSGGTMSEDSYDARTGVATHKLYSKYYDAGTWLVPKQLGISVVVDHEKTYVPVLSGLQQSLGLLGPGGLSADGKVTVYLWNFDQGTIPVRFVRVVAWRSPQPLEAKTIVALPKQKTGGVLGTIQISNYGTEIPIKVECEVSRTRKTVELKLVRRTFQELNGYFKPGGAKPPYPWYAAP